MEWKTSDKEMARAPCPDKATLQLPEFNRYMLVFHEKEKNIGGRKRERDWFLPPMLTDHFHDRGKVVLDATQQVMYKLQCL